MATTFATPNTLLGLYQPKSQAARLVSALAIAFIGSVLITMAAKVNVPTWPVPVTLQSMAIAIIAGAFGFRMATATVGLYLAQGIAGLPVFAGAFAGLPYVFGPTGGFLVGFLAMAAIIGWLADRGAMRNVFSAFGAMLAGATVMFVFGFVWLMTMAGQAAWIDQSNAVASAFQGAVQPFIVWDIVKMAFAALTVVGGWSLLSRK
ncbi:biotin transporter BioY [Pelagibacterium luteolum]|uniref:Biotin transporter n=1 Tax=Pelagibacterium luteolum TaxID=440168 RepID=A0A1G7TU99_9HYPH|nr:biotin transporter BioY [Pelagibacterium luteolum]SDG38812.1 biotin transport system substrate-specific component [Pelagibacterium luteolum]